ncbi:MAG TPA: T9SS type A sorting domain-containing protein [Candidatus Cloacimonetes bacterium]|nr:T9SS type A sorting domain-containing protein [Candidatus Cloacimonadota bacterium]
MKKYLALLFCLCCVLNIAAQAENDSTFVCYYSPTAAIHPNWEYCSSSYGTNASSVFEMYDGSFGVQMLTVYNPGPPLESLTFQSPIAAYNRSGQYLKTIFGPVSDEGGVMEDGYYSHIIRDGMGGYLALDRFHPGIHRLDANLQFAGYQTISSSFGHVDRILELLAVNDGFVALSHIAGADNYAISKLNYDLSTSWERCTEMTGSVRSLSQTSDGGYIAWCSGRQQESHYYLNTFRFSAQGDSIWTTGQLSPYVEKIVEVNSRYYGLAYEPSGLHIYDFGINLLQGSPDDAMLVIPTYNLLPHDVYGFDPQFKVIRTSDDCVVVAVSTPMGEIFKFDSNFTLLWTCNALEDERMGIGRQPLIELANGDLLYCAEIRSPFLRIALVRVDTSGHVTALDDPIIPAAAPSISAYPNPFNKELVVELKNVPKLNSRLEVYNLKGQLIRRLKVADSEAIWDGRDAANKPCANGIYFIKLTENGRILSSKKVTLLR